MTVCANESEHILKVLVEVLVDLSMTIPIYESNLNTKLQIQTNNSDKKLKETCTKLIEARVPIYENVVDTYSGYYDDVDGISSAETIDTLTDLEETVDYIARTMEIISESSKEFQDEVDSLNESLETYASSLISDQCFEAYESLMKPFENFKGSDVQIEGLLLSARVSTFLCVSTSV